MMRILVEWNNTGITSIQEAEGIVNLNSGANFNRICAEKEKAITMLQSINIDTTELENFEIEE